MSRYESALGAVSKPPAMQVAFYFPVDFAIGLGPGLRPMIVIL